MVDAPKKRLKHTEARADGWNIICPYKACGHMFEVVSAKKQDIVTCPNCSKQSKIVKLI